jgi:hypothetical protein
MSGAAVTPRAATSDDVLALVRDVLGVTPLRAERQTFGHNSVTFDVILPDGNSNVIVRTNVDAWVFAGTERNLHTLAGLRLPVPQVLAADLSQCRYPFAYLVLPKIPGRDLRYELGVMTEAQMTRLAEQIVGFQRTVMTALPPGEGFGYVPIGECGPRASWWDLIRPTQVPRCPSSAILPLPTSPVASSVNSRAVKPTSGPSHQPAFWTTSPSRTSLSSAASCADWWTST